MPDTLGHAYYRGLLTWFRDLLLHGMEYPDDADWSMMREGLVDIRQAIAEDLAPEFAIGTEGPFQQLDMHLEDHNPGNARWLRRAFEQMEEVIKQINLYLNQP